MVAYTEPASNMNPYSIRVNLIVGQQVNFFRSYVVSSVIGSYHEVGGGAVNNRIYNRL